MKFGKILVSFVAWVVLLGPGTSPADDTDVYFDPAGQKCGDQNNNGNATDPGEFPCVEPLIMLTLDMRSNAISSGNLCTLGTDCETVFGQEVNDQLLQLDQDWDLGLAGTDLTLFDAIRAVYASVFLDLEGVKLGLMVNHTDAGSAEGGAYVLRGFRSMVKNDTNGAKEELIRKMYSIPKPRQTSGGGGGGGGTTPAPTPTPAVCTGSTAKRTLTVDGMTFEVNDIVVNEGDTGVFTITGSGTNSSGDARQVTWVTQVGSAESTDFTAASGAQTVNKNGEPFQGGTPKGQLSVSVPTAFDGIAEPPGSEAFSLKLNVTKTERVKGKDVVTVVGTVSATATLCDVAAGSLSIANATVYEGATAQFVVTLSRAQAAAVTVGYQVVDGTAGAADRGTSTPASPLTIPAGQTSATISVPTVDDIDTVEETFSVELTSVSDPKLSLSVAEATGTIRPTPLTCEPNEISATDSHQYQGASLYFELFRYLTGGDVYLGHEGASDFTGPANKNLDEECYLPGFGSGYDYLADHAYSPGARTPPNGILAWDLGGAKPADTTNPLVEEKAGGSSRYVSPITEDQECAGIYAIDMLFGVSNDPGKGDSIYADMNKPANQGGLGQPSGQGVAEGSTDPFADALRILADTDLGSDAYTNVNGGNNVLEGTQNVQSYIIRVVSDGDTSEKLVPPFCDGEQQGSAGGQFKAYCENGKATVIPVAASDLLKLKAELENLIDSIISTSTTYVAASVPVNVFNRADINDNVFIALFSVDEEKGPYWYGNLKKLKIEQNGSSIRLVAANGVDAVGSDGRIADNALTFWTKPDALPVPDMTPPVSPPDIDAGDDQIRKKAGVDGRIVTRGAAGQLIPGYIVSDTDPNRGNPGLGNDDFDGARRLFTVASGTGALQAMDADNDTVADDFVTYFGNQGITISRDDAKHYMCWMRGIGNCVAALGSAADPVARTWLFADAIHSRPLPLNYGARAGRSVDNPDIRLLLGTNDGLFHMFQNTNDNGSESGVENWAFMPPQHLLNAQRLESNTPGVLPPHPYGVDGEPVVVVNAGDDGVTIGDDTGDYAWLYFAMRRGGSAICALDITDPDSPQYLWTKTCIDDQLPGFGEMGLSFSNPVATKVKYGETTRQVLIFGGGYHGGWVDSPVADGDRDTNRVGYDKETYDAAADTGMRGNAVYVVDAATGALLWKAVAQEDASLPTGAKEYLEPGLTDSIAAEVSVVEQLGIATRAYVGDLGGNVWRIDMPKNMAYDPAISDTQDNRDSWSIRKIAELGGDGGADRKFFHRIDVVFGIDPAGGTNAGFDALLIGSGDREWPKSLNVQDYMFMIKDTNGGSDVITIDELANADCFLAATDRPSGTVCGTNNATANAQLAAGWKLPLADTGEKMLGTSLTVGGRTFFSTYRPLGGKPAKCGGNEGAGRFYSISLFNAAPVENRNLIDDGGNVEPSTLVDRYCDTCLPPGIPPPELVPLGTDSFLLGLTPVQSGISNRYRTHWYEKDVD